MATGNQKLGFAIRAVNEAEKVLRDIKREVEETGETVEDLADSGQIAATGLDAIAEAGGNAEQFLRGISDLTNFLGEQFGVQLGPLQEWSAALADAAGGVEAVLTGGPALIGQMKGLVAGLGPAIATTWSYVTALAAQTVAFIAANAPIILVVGSIALLAGGIYLLVQHWDTIVEKVPFLGTALEAVRQVAEPALGFIVEAGTKVYEFFRDNWQLILTLLSGPFAPLVFLATDMFGVRSAIVGAGQAVLGFFSGAVEGGWNLIEDYIITPVSNAITTIERAFGGIAGVVTTALSGVGGAVEGAFSGVVGTVTGIINGLIDAYNNSIGRAPGVPNIPRIGGGGGGTTPSTYGVDPGIANAAGTLNPDRSLTPPPNGGGALFIPSGAGIPAPGGRTGGGVVEVHISALDAQSTRDWLNRGGTEEIARALGGRTVFE